MGQGEPEEGSRFLNAARTRAAKRGGAASGSAEASRVESAALPAKTGPQNEVASGRIERTQGMIFSADETAGVGVDDATSVTTDYKERDNAFTGKILKVTIDVKPMGAALKAEADLAQRMAAVKKALSD